MKKHLDWKRVKCFYRGCDEIVTVPIFADEIVYCTKHQKLFSQNLQNIHNSWNNKLIYRNGEDK